MMDIYRLHWRGLGQHPVSEDVRNKSWPGRLSVDKMQKNAEHYAKWVMATIEKHCGPLPKGRMYNSLCIYMSPKNLERLRLCLSPMDYLNWAPKELDDISDLEFGLSKKEAFVRD